MYSERFQKSLAAVEAAREKNIALEPERMTAKQKEDLLAAYHPDYKQDEFAILKVGPNSGEKVPTELAEICIKFWEINKLESFFVLMKPAIAGFMTLTGFKK